MEKLRIIQSEKTYCKYNGKPAVRCKFLKSSDQKILQQTININSIKWQKLLEKTGCNTLKNDADNLIRQLEGKQFIAEVYQDTNKKGQKWAYIKF